MSRMIIAQSPPRLRDPYCILVWKFSVDDDHAERFTELCDQFG